MRRVAVRWRLTIWYGAVLTVLVVGFGVTVFVLTCHNVQRQLDAILVEELREIRVEIALAEKED